jgi:hypothetical protein
MIVKYNCKFCGKPGSVEIEDNDATLFVVEKWAKILCCARCADFQVAKRKIADVVKERCMYLMQMRATPTTKPEKLKETEKKTRQSLVILCANYARIVCLHYKVKNDFDESFAEELMSHPNQFHAILGHCEYVVRRQSQPLLSTL